MSNVDPLARMAQALREARSGESSDAHVTRARILSAAASLPTKRKSTLWLVPIAAVLVVSSAAASPAVRRVFQTHVGHFVDSRFAAIRNAIRREGSHVADKRRGRTGDTGSDVDRGVSGPSDSAVPNGVAPSAVIAPNAIAYPRDTAAPSDIVTTPGAVGRSNPVRPPKALARGADARRKVQVKGGAQGEVSRENDAPPPSPPSRSVSADDDGSRLYAAAHEAHFLRHDAAAALAAWDLYLRERPDGAFAPEAQYNRALCLVRLERFDEAREALRPFRAGRYGSYRRREASILIDAIADK